MTVSKVIPPSPGAPRRTTPPPTKARHWTWVLLAAAALALLGCLCVVGALIVAGSWLYPVRQSTSVDLGSAATVELPVAETPPAALPTGTSLPASPTIEPSPSATTIPTSEPTAQTASATAPSSLYAEYNGFSFQYDPVLAGSVQAETIPEVSGAEVPEWEVTPQHIQFTFNQYALSQSALLPQIWVYPVEDFRRLNALVEGTILDLEGLLVEKPAEIPSGNLPFLPPWNAAQLIRARYGYLAFKDGSGIRFLTQFGQDAYPINNQDLIYTFQGMTEDGAYYISAVLPVAHPSLPDPSTITLDRSFYENFTTYADQTEQMLNLAADGEFTPALTVLDALLQSIQIR